MDNREIAEILEEMATLLNLKGVNPFKVKAYDRAAATIQSMTEDVVDVHKAGGLSKIKGVGSSIAKILEELVDKGTAEQLEELRKEIPEGLFDVMRLPGLGPKKINKLWKELDITSLSELSYACNENRLLDLKGFGKKTQEKILEGIKHLAASQGRHLYPFAESIADDFLTFIRGLKQVKRADLAGSIRRGRETIKDLDILVESDEPKPIMDAVVKLPNVREVIGTGDTKTSVRLDSGIAVDVRVVSAEAYPYALIYFTGSKDHNVAMRARARDQGFSLNEYELKPLGKNKSPKGFSSEADIHRFLGLDYIPPELREDTGEIDAASAKELPSLLQESDIKGVLHIHTRASDGSATIPQICEQAIALGYEYIGISDHSKAAFYANGLDEKRLADQAKEIEKARKKYAGKLRVFHGIEADILPNGDIDLDDAALAELDFVIASVHSVLNMSRDDMTKRLKKALSHPAVKVLGHPTGRIVLGRKGFTFDWEAIFDAAKKHDVAMELNANPHRLDLDWVQVKRAREKGVKVCINPDAHAAEALADTRYGVLTARRGWACKDDVVNTLSADDFARDFLGLTASSK